MSIKLKYKLLNINTLQVKPPIKFRKLLSQNATTVLLNVIY